MVVESPGVSSPNVALAGQVALWERQPFETNLWFRRFQVYLYLGYRRSLYAAYRDDFELTSSGRDEKKISTGTPGAWRAAALKWNWVERAEAWDADVSAMVERALKETWQKLALSGPQAAGVLISLLSDVDIEQRRLAATSLLQRLFTLYGRGEPDGETPPIQLVEYA